MVQACAAKGPGTGCGAWPTALQKSREAFAGWQTALSKRLLRSDRHRLWQARLRCREGLWQPVPTALLGPEMLLWAGKRRFRNASKESTCTWVWQARLQCRHVQPKVQDGLWSLANDPAGSRDAFEDCHVQP